MIFVFIGAPGAGKGTQAQLLADKGYRQISTGEALRKHVREGTPLGQKVKAVMESGELVSDDILLEILNEEVGNNTDEKIILDGYPRNLEQAKTLQSYKMSHDIKGAVLIDIDQQELVDRLTGRRVCAKCGTNFHVRFNPPKSDAVCDKCGGEVVHRPDDYEDKVKTRLSVYDQQTKPVIDFYRDMNMLHIVDGNNEIKAVSGDLEKVLSTLN